MYSCILFTLFQQAMCFTIYGMVCTTSLFCMLLSVCVGLLLSLLMLLLLIIIDLCRYTIWGGGARPWLFSINLHATLMLQRFCRPGLEKNILVPTMSRTRYLCILNHLCLGHFRTSSRSVGIGLSYKIAYNMGALIANMLHLLTIIFF